MIQKFKMWTNKDSVIIVCENWFDNKSNKLKECRLE